MVFVNDKKFACESCVKGHRSSSCKHDDRPLYEIKKKGRPVSQCEKCRALRHSKRMHSKCLCNLPEGTETAVQAPAPRKKSGRFVPVTPSLPNGISDALMGYDSGSNASHSKQRVNSLLNPCTCKSIWKCRCRTQTVSNIATTSQNGLATLARAAALHQSCPTSTSTSTSTSTTSNTSPISNSKLRSYRPSTPPNLHHKRRNNRQRKHAVPGPSLPPILLSSPSFSALSHQIPEFPTIPPMSTIASLAGSGCTCGLYCACPGCVEHRGEEHVSENSADCASGCGTCVDWRGGIGLPATNQLSSPGCQSSSIINQFLACAAALPLPPVNRNRYTGVDIDPVNVVVYPAHLFSNNNNDVVEGSNDSTTKKRAGAFNIHGREAVFGLVKVPKLDCCGGRCGCPEDGCTCGRSCDGRCGEHGERRSMSSTGSVSSGGQASPQAPATRSCCVNRLAARS